MLDYAWVNDRIAVGGHLDGDKLRLQELLDSGVTHIINLQSEEDDSPILMGHDMVYLHVGVGDDHKPKDVEWFRQIIAFSLWALTSPHTKIYIHCAAGLSRSTSAVYAILRALGFCKKLSEELVMSARPRATLNYKDSADEAIKILGYSN